MSTLVKLLQLYEAEGLSVRTGLNPLHIPGGDPAEIPFTYIFQNGQKAVKGGGPAIDEIAMFEALFENFKPQNIFNIGNAYGWSTLALALMNPQAKVVAIDLCPRPEEEKGIEVTNSIAQKNGLNAVAIKARSPEQVGDVASEQFDSPIDFAFIDGGHTNEQQIKDFSAIKDVAAEHAVYVFHDVVNFGMTQSFVEISQANPHLICRIMMRTSSGMAVAYPACRDGEVGPAINAFCEDDGRVQQLLAEGRAILEQNR